MAELELIVRDLLAFYELEGDHFKDTPRRVVALLKDFNLHIDNVEPYDALNTVFDSDVDEMIVQVNIPFKMLCAHHLLPAYGVAHVGYIPQGKIVGLSKLCRLVDLAGRIKPSTQEDITAAITEAIEEKLKPLGCGAVVAATHTCLTIRGANTPGVITKTSSMIGVFRDKPEARAEFLDMIRG